jgi:hypothetical protein
VREILSAGPPDENFLIRFRTTAHTPRATAAMLFESVLIKMTEKRMTLHG